MNIQRISPFVWIALAIMICVGATYRNVSENEFAYDDVVIVETNPRVVGGLGQTREIFATEYWNLDIVESRLYRPVTLLSFASEVSFWGLSASRFHVTNVILHVLSTLLFVLLALKLLGSHAARLGTNERGWAAGAAGVLFSIHPLYTEAVAGLVGRAELLSAVFTLGFLLALLSRGNRRFAAAPLVFLALLSKETSSLGIYLYFVLCVFGLGVHGGRFRTRIAEFGRGLLVMSPGLFLAGVLRYSVLHDIPKPTLYFVDNPLVTSSLLERIATASTIFLTYLRLVFWPTHLSPDYGYNAVPVHQFSDPSAILATSVICVSTLAGLLLFRNSLKREEAGLPSLIGVGLAWYVGCTIVVSNFFILIPTTVAERLAYLPSMGFFLILAALLGMLRQRGQAALYSAIIVFILLLGPFAKRSDQRVRAWKNNDTLFSAAILDQPQSHRVWAELGKIRMDQGRLAEAKEYLLKSREIYPEWSKTHDRLVKVFMDLNELDSARSAAEDLRVLDPGNTVAFYALARAHQSEGNFDAALREVRAGMAVDPAYLPFHLVEGEVLQAQGEIPSAVDSYLRVLNQSPGLQSLAVRVGPLLVQTERWEEAIVVYRSLFNTNKEWSYANYLAWSLFNSVGDGPASSIDGQARLEEAKTAAEVAIQLAPPETSHYPKDTLGQILWRLGNRDEAMDIFKKLVEERPAEVSYLETLELYEQSLRP